MVNFKEMKILFLEADKYSKESIEKLNRVAEIVHFSTADPIQNVLDTLATNQFDAIFTRLGFPILEETIKNQKQLKYVVTPTTGLNHIDTQYLETNQIQCISLKGEIEFLKKIQSTAEHTWSLILSVMRTLNLAFNNVKAGNWDRSQLLCEELNTKTIGIIGFGRLGSIVANYAKAFNMNICVNDTDENKMQEAGNLGFEVCSKSKLLNQSDVVVLLVDWKPENENMISEDEFNQFKNTAYFVNTSRGELVDEQALLKALKDRKIKGAALDVLRDDSSWSKETPKQHELIEYAKNNNNLIITPHIGGYGDVSIANTRNFVVDKFLSKL